MWVWMRGVWCVTWQIVIDAKTLYEETRFEQTLVPVSQRYGKGYFQPLPKFVPRGASTPSSARTTPVSIAAAPTPQHGEVRAYSCVMLVHTHVVNSSRDPPSLTCPTTHTHTRTHARTHTHARARTRTRTHTQMRVPAPPLRSANTRAAALNVSPRAKKIEEARGPTTVQGAPNAGQHGAVTRPLVHRGINRVRAGTTVSEPPSPHLMPVPPASNSVSNVRPFRTHSAQDGQRTLLLVLLLLLVRCFCAGASAATVGTVVLAPCVVLSFRGVAWCSTGSSQFVPFDLMLGRVRAFLRACVCVCVCVCMCVYVHGCTRARSSVPAPSPCDTSGKRWLDTRGSAS